jgi:hypothetical protein
MSEARDTSNTTILDLCDVASDQRAHIQVLEEDLATVRRENADKAEALRQAQGSISTWERLHDQQRERADKASARADELSRDLALVRIDLSAAREGRNIAHQQGYEAAVSELWEWLKGDPGENVTDMQRLKEAIDKASDDWAAEKVAEDRRARSMLPAETSETERLPDGTVSSAVYREHIDGHRARADESERRYTALRAAVEKAGLWSADYCDVVARVAIAADKPPVEDIDPRQGKPGGGTDLLDGPAPPVRVADMRSTEGIFASCLSLTAEGGVVASCLRDALKHHREKRPADAVASLKGCIGRTSGGPLGAGLDTLRHRLEREAGQASGTSAQGAA